MPRLTKELPDKLSRLAGRALPPRMLLRRNLPTLPPLLPSNGDVSRPRYDSPSEDDEGSSEGEVSSEDDEGSSEGEALTPDGNSEDTSKASKNDAAVDKMTVPQLKEAIEERGIDHKGLKLKEEFRNRLKAHF
jgi:hypothetical protein